MNPRERIRTALSHQQPDCLPIDFGGMRSTGIQAVAYNKLLAHLGLHNESTRLYDIFQQLAEPSEAMVDRFNGDVLQVHRLCPAFGIDILEWKPGRLPDGSACLVPKGFNPVKNAKGGHDVVQNGQVIATMPEGGLYFDQVIHPYANATTPAEVEAIRLDPLDEQEAGFLAAQAAEKRAASDKALLFAFGGNILEAGQLDFGYETFYMNLALEPELMHYYFGRLAEYYIHALDTLIPAMANDIDLIQFGDDLGTQEATQISVDMYREMIKPYHKRIFMHARRRWPQLKVFFHSCGAVADLIPDLIDAGVDVLNPVQISAKGMDPAMLKREFGKDISFWGGGVNMQQTVVTGSVQDIKDEARRHIEIFSKDGGYVFTQVHNIQANVPPEKVIAIYEAAAEFR
ncbi:MAG: uroporphyrinogen decarboxylase family protein [Clostridia bacterium]